MYYQLCHSLMMAMDKVFESILLDVWVNMVCLVYRSKHSSIYAGQTIDYRLSNLEIDTSRDIELLNKPHPSLLKVWLNLSHTFNQNSRASFGGMINNFDLCLILRNEKSSAFLRVARAQRINIRTYVCVTLIIVPIALHSHALSLHRHAHCSSSLLPSCCMYTRARRSRDIRMQYACIALLDSRA